MRDTSAEAIAKDEIQQNLYQVSDRRVFRELHGFGLKKVEQIWIYIN